MDEVAALPIAAGSVVPSAPAVLRPPPTPTRHAAHFPGAPVIGRVAPTATADRRAGEGLPSSRRHLLNVPRPIRREVPRGCASRLFAPSMAFALTTRARLLLFPTRRQVWLTTRQASLDATDRSVGAPRGAVKGEMGGTTDTTTPRAGWNAGPGLTQRPGEAGGRLRCGSARRG